MEEIYSELLQKVQNCAVQRDLNYLSTIVEKKANIEEVNESLQGKANKTSVAQALQRKANKTDLDQALEGKADVADMEQLCSIVENKAELCLVEQITK